MRTPAAVEEAILRAREQLQEGPHVIGWAVGIAASTVHAVLRRHGRSRLVTRPRPEDVIRYEHPRPGDLIHVDIKKLGRILKPGHRVTGDRSKRAKGTAGWQYLFVAIDDHSRLAYAELLAGQDAEACVRFLERAATWCREQGIVVERVLSDKATAYHSRAWLEATARLEIERRYTRIYRPRTNGKAERFIQDAAARVGIRAQLPVELAARSRLGWVPALVQPAPTPQLARCPATDQPRLTPLWSRHLAREQPPQHVGQDSSVP
jgi:transposase InsO family protein